MRIFFIASVIPRPPHDTRAPNVVVHAAIHAFKTLGHEAVLQLIFDETQRALTAEETARLQELSEAGIQLLPILWSSNRRMRQRFFSRVERFYPAAILQNEIAQRVTASCSDVVFSLWSNPALPAGASVRGIPNGLYYGNLDYKSLESRLANPRMFNESLRDYIRMPWAWWQMREMRKIHFQLARQFHPVWNVCEVDAHIQRDHGIPSAKYIQNMWPLPLERDYPGLRARMEKTAPPKICASIGGLQGTANSFGLAFIGDKLAPALSADRRTAGAELHVFGAREPARRVAAALKKPNIRRRGYVDDIDTEILESPVFLMCNNCGHYKAGHTRFLHAWSLHSCVIAHANNKTVMPELIHGENVLLAKDEYEFVDLIAKCIADPALRAHIGEGGRRTFEKLFLPEVVISKVAKELGEASSAMAAAQHDLRGNL